MEVISIIITKDNVLKVVWGFKKYQKFLNALNKEFEHKVES